MDKEEIYKRIVNILPKERIEKNAAMSKHSGMKCGGCADFFVIVETVEELTDLIKFISDIKIRYFILGNGTNVLFSDEQFEGIVIKLSGDFSEIVFDNMLITVGAGASLTYLSKLCSEYGLGGLEFACGIPGSVGGGIYMNAGAYDGNMQRCIQSVVAINMNGEIYEYEKDELDFSYRHSRFFDSNEIILFAKIKLENKDKNEIKALMQEYTNRRKEKQPLNYPSLGSFFKRPEGNYASKLIEDCGLKAAHVGDAEVSTLHAGFIINKGNATSSDVINLSNYIIDTVKEKTGFVLEPEVKIVK